MAKENSDKILSLIIDMLFDNEKDVEYVKEKVLGAKGSEHHDK